jgi:hypothetical protein
MELALLSELQQALLQSFVLCCLAGTWPLLSIRMQCIRPLLLCCMDYPLLTGATKFGRAGLTCTRHGLTAAVALMVMYFEYCYYGGDGTYAPQNVMSCTASACWIGVAARSVCIALH